MLRALCTEDVPTESLLAFAEELSPQLTSDPDGERVCLRSMEPPSWIVLHAIQDWWATVLGGYAALYVAELVKEAAKDSWKNRAKAITAVVGTGNAIWTLALGIRNLRQRVRPVTDIKIAIPVPSDFWSASLNLHTDEPEIVAVQVALFVHHLPELSKLIEKQGLADGRAAGGIHLQLKDDGALDVRWQDGDTFEPCQAELPFCPYGDA